MVRGGQRQIVCENGDLADITAEGARKQKHIASVLDVLYQRGFSVRPDEIVLVDDDLFNVEEARDHGMRGALFNLESTAKLPRPRRRGSVVEMEAAAQAAARHEEARQLRGSTPPMAGRIGLARAKSMPLEEVPLERGMAAESPTESRRASGHD